MRHPSRRPRSRSRARRAGAQALALAAALCLAAGDPPAPAAEPAPAMPAAEPAPAVPAAEPRWVQDGGAAPTLAETRLTMGKWIETQQIISKERNDWQQGKEILLGRLELVKQEIATLEEKNREAASSVTEANGKRDALLAENEELKLALAQITAAAGGMEGEVSGLLRLVPAPIAEKLLPLRERMPTDAATTRVAVAERFQNILGILNELNRASNDITVAYEVRTLADGKPSEVQALYVGLAQAYYVSAGGEAGTGRPGAEGWLWEPSKSIANDVLMALEIHQGKHSPAFVPLPVTLR